MNYNSFPTKKNFCSLHDRRKRHGEIDIQEGSVLNKSGDDVYKQQMMDNFRFSSASIASPLAKPNPTIRGGTKGIQITI